MSEFNYHPLADATLPILKRRRPAGFDITDVVTLIGNGCYHQCYYQVAQDICSHLAREGEIVELSPPKFTPKTRKLKQGGVYRFERNDAR